MMCIYPLDSVYIMHANAALSGCGSLTTSWVGCCMISSAWHVIKNACLQLQKLHETMVQTACVQGSPTTVKALM